MTTIQTTPLNGGPDFEVALVADFGALAPTRHEVARRLAAHGLLQDAVDNALLVVCELCTNAVQATLDQDAPILLRVLMGDAALVIEVENVGPRFDSAPASAGDDRGAYHEGGRGLAIIRALSHDVSVHVHAGRCTVRAIMGSGSR